MFSGIKMDGYEPNLDSYPYFSDGLKGLDG
jgi:hypothetical protein